MGIQRTSLTEQVTTDSDREFPFWDAFLSPRDIVRILSVTQNIITFIMKGMIKMTIIISTSGLGMGQRSIRCTCDQKWACNIKLTITLATIAIQM